MSTSLNLLIITKKLNKYTVREEREATSLTKQDVQSSVTDTWWSQRGKVNIDIDD